MDNEVINDQPFSLQTLIQYISENFIGLLLLILAIFIVYIVDYIARLNSVFLVQSSIPGMASSTPSIPFIKQPKIKGKKFKKH